VNSWHVNLAGYIQYIQCTGQLQEDFLTSTVCRVSIFPQCVLITGVSPNGRPGVRVLVDQALNTFPTAKPKDNSPKYISTFTTAYTKSCDVVKWPKYIAF